MVPLLLIQGSGGVGLPEYGKVVVILESVQVSLA
jgi:hypothetical protein